MSREVDCVRKALADAINRGSDNEASYLRAHLDSLLNKKRSPGKTTLAEARAAVVLATLINADGDLWIGCGEDEERCWSETCGLTRGQRDAAIDPLVADDCAILTADEKRVRLRLDASR